MPPPRSDNKKWNEWREKIQAANIKAHREKIDEINRLNAKNNLSGVKIEF